MLPKLHALTTVVCSVIALAATVVPSTSAKASTLPAPTDFRVTQTGFDRLEVAWSRVSNAELYRVLVNGVQRGAAYDPESTLTVTQLRPGTTYEFEIQAGRSPGEFGPGARLSATTLADDTPPTAPTGLREHLDPSGKSLGITWNPSTDNWGVSSTYNIYADGRLITRGGAPALWQRLTDPYVGGLSCGKTYTFTVQAFDLNNNLSTESGSLAAATAC